MSMKKYVLGRIDFVSGLVDGNRMVGIYSRLVWLVNG